MTYEEALHRLLNTNCDDCDIECVSECDICREAVDLVYGLIGRADKYKWHDLRKEPTDLPEFNGNEVAVMFLTEHGFYNLGYYGENGRYRDKYFRNSRDAYEGYDMHCVAAWKYIEPFEGIESRYCWHDLKKNPNDLPDAKTMNFSEFQIEVEDKYFEAVITPSFNITKNFIALVNGKEVLINSSNVTAWREVELFEEG